MTRNELQQYIREGIRTEESAVNIYYKHLRSVITRSGLDKRSQEKIRARLEQLSLDSQGHRRRLESILAALEEESENDL